MTRLRYLLVVDFEATCDNSGAVVPRGEMEVIELPTLLYDMEEDKVQATFHEYVRPVKHSTLTKFCTDLTGIEQNTVEAAEPFPSVWERYLDFLKTHGILAQPETAAFLTCGDWDLKTMLPQQLSLSGIDASAGLASRSTATPERPAMGAFPPPFDQWINVKKSFQVLYGMRHAKGMEGMLRRAGMELEGRHHSGIDDCKNILRIVQRMRADGWKPWLDLPRAAA